LTEQRPAIVSAECLRGRGRDDVAVHAEEVLGVVGRAEQAEQYFTDALARHAAAAVAATGVILEHLTRWLPTRRASVDIDDDTVSFASMNIAP
jgi:hypothetical protein